MDQTTFRRFLTLIGRDPLVVDFSPPPSPTPA
jgi:hypothetical protein